MALFSPAALQQYADQIAAQPQPTLSAPAPASPPGIGIAPYAAMVAGNLADGASTWWDLARGYGTEGNPLYPNSGPGVMAIRALETLPEAYIMQRLAAAGHPNWARLFGYAMGAYGGGLAIHNLNVARQAGR